MHTPHDEHLISERHQWMDAAVALAWAGRLIGAHVHKLDRDLSLQRKDCSHCERELSNPSIKFYANGGDGSSICDYCIRETYRTMRMATRGPDGKKRRRGGDRKRVAYPSRPLPPSFVREIMSDILSRHHGVTFAQVNDGDRRPGPSQARDEIMWHLRARLNAAGKQTTWTQIGDWLGRDHTSVMAAVKRHQWVLGRLAEAPPLAA